MNRKLLVASVSVFAVLVLAGCNGQGEAEDVKEKAVEGVAVVKQKAEEKKMEKESQTESEAMGYKDISPAMAKKMIDENSDLIVIDVSPKFDEGHLPGAINHYVGDGSLDEAIPSLDMDATYLVYCHVDSASILGAQKLIDAGFENVYRLEGNYQAWVDAGYPVEK